MLLLFFEFQEPKTRPKTRLQLFDTDFYRDQVYSSQEFAPRSKNNHNHGHGQDFDHLTTVIFKQFLTMTGLWPNGRNRGHLAPPYHQPGIQFLTTSYLQSSMLYLPPRAIMCNEIYALICPLSFALNLPQVHTYRIRLLAAITAGVSIHLQ